MVLLSGKTGYNSKEQKSTEKAKGLEASFLISVSKSTLETIDKAP